MIFIFVHTSVEKAHPATFFDQKLSQDDILTGNFSKLSIFFQNVEKIPKKKAVIGK